MYWTLAYTSNEIDTSHAYVCFCVWHFDVDGYYTCESYSPIKRTHTHTRSSLLRWYIISIVVTCASACYLFATFDLYTSDIILEWYLVCTAHFYTSKILKLFIVASMWASFQFGGMRKFYWNGKIVYVFEGAWANGIRFGLSRWMDGINEWSNYFSIEFIVRFLNSNTLRIHCKWENATYYDDIRTYCTNSMSFVSYI